MFSNYLYIIYFMYQLGLINAMQLAHMSLNLAVQYSTIVGGAACGDITKISPKTALEPFRGLLVAYKFIKVAKDAQERKSRLATLAAVLALSARTITTDPAINMSQGATVSGYINYMETVMQARGGFLLKFTPVFVINQERLINQKKIQFVQNGKEIIHNIFTEHTARRCMNGNIQKIGTIKLISAYTNSPTVIPLNIVKAVGWTSLGIGSITLIVVGGLCIFQYAEKKRNSKTIVVVNSN